MFAPGSPVYLRYTSRPGRAQGIICSVLRAFIVHFTSSKTNGNLKKDYTDIALYSPNEAYYSLPKTLSRYRLPDRDWLQT